MTVAGGRIAPPTGGKGEASRNARGETNDVCEALRPLCSEIETQLRQYLDGALSALIRSYLPQIWTFTTEKGTATLVVSEDGRVTVADGLDLAADVHVTWAHDRLVAALWTGDRSRIPSGELPRVEFRTRKGLRTFNFLRVRFGL